MIANGSVILAADIAGLTSSILTALQAQNAGPSSTLGHPLVFAWHGVVLAAPAYRRKAVFVSPFDALIDTVAVTTGDMTPGATTSVTLTGAEHGDIIPWATTVTGSSKATRTLLRGGRARVDGEYLLSSPTPRTLHMGGTYTIEVGTTSVAAGGMVQVVLALRSVWGRG